MGTKMTPSYSNLFMEADGNSSDVHVNIVYGEEDDEELEKANEVDVNVEVKKKPHLEEGNISSGVNGCHHFTHEYESGVGTQGGVLTSWL